MGKKLNRVYHALIEGAESGLESDGLYEHVMQKCPQTSSKRVVKAALLALSDPDVKERETLEIIYALAIRYRLVRLGVEDEAEDDDDDVGAPTVSQGLKTRLESSVADVPN